MATLPALTPTNFTEALAFAEALSTSTMVPPAFQRNPANILVAIQWGAELGMGPLQALQNIAVINGKPAVYGDAMLALVRGSPVCEDVIERLERNANGDITGATCEAHRKGKAPVVATFSVADAKRAQLWDKAGPWKQYPARMLQMRARGFALRDAFPDVLHGIISAEEAVDTPRIAKDITPSSTSAELDAFAGAAAAQERDPAADAPDGAVHEDTSSAASAEAAEPDPATPVSPPDSPPEESGEELRPGSPPEGDAPLFETIKPSRLRRGGWDWPAYADEITAIAKTVSPEQFPQFRAANRSMIDALQRSDNELWSRVQQALADYERGPW